MLAEKSTCQYISIVVYGVAWNVTRKITHGSFQNRHIPWNKYFCFTLLSLQNSIFTLPFSFGPSTIRGKNRAHIRQLFLFLSPTLSILSRTQLRSICLRNKPLFRELLFAPLSTNISKSNFLVPLQLSNGRVKTWDVKDRVGCKLYSTLFTR